MPTRHSQRVTQWLILAVLLVAMVALLGYIYDVQSLYRLASYLSVALHTTVTFIVLCLAVLALSPEQGVTALFTSDRAGGFLARRLLPAGVGVPIVLGWLRLIGQRAGLYDAEVGLSLLVLSNVVVFLVLVGWNVATLDRVDAERRGMEEALRESQARLTGIIDSAMDAIITVDATHQIERLLAAGARTYLTKPLDVKQFLRVVDKLLE